LKQEIYHLTKVKRSGLPEKVVKEQITSQFVKPKQKQINNEDDDE